LQFTWLSFTRKPKPTGPLIKTTMLTNLIEAIKKGDITNLEVIVSIMEADESLTRTELDLAYQNGRVDVLNGDYKRSYSDWKYPKNTEGNISDSQK
jgi:hypothetical protein